MFIQTQYKTLYAYHFDTVQRLLTGAAKLSEADYRANPGYGRGSIHDLLFHTLVTDLRWRAGLETGKRMPVLPAEEFPDVNSLQTFCENEKRAWLDYLAGLSDEDIAGDAIMTASSGETSAIPRWRILQHVVLHGMQHGAELAELLTLKGQSPGNIDFIFYA
jgi:uncharacterized damage-inducible protein DinB